LVVCTKKKKEEEWAGDLAMAQDEKGKKLQTRTEETGHGKGISIRKITGKSRNG